MKNILVLFLIIAGCFVSEKIYAQSICPEPGEYPQVCDDVCGGTNCNFALCMECIDLNQDHTDVPIDGGLSWLLLAGAGLAGNHIRKKRKKRNAGLVAK